MRPSPKRHAATLLAAAALAGLAQPAAAQADQTLARQLLAEAVASNTAPSGGTTTRPLVDLLVRHLRAADFSEADIATPAISEALPSLVVRYRSPNPQARPVLLMAHMDVVEALPADWSYPPFELTEEDGWLYGRGSEDNKAGVAILVANFIRLKQEGFVPDRDLIVMLTADEETNGLSAQQLLSQHSDLVDAEFALNTDGGGVIADEAGNPQAFIMQTAEKVYATYAFTASDPGGHSSLPKPDSPISAVARALVALEDWHFPINLGETSRSFFRQWSVVADADERPLLAALAAYQPGDLEPAGLAANPYYNSLARTTCVATGLTGGHAENALPQNARAVINCRVLPQESEASVRERLAALAAPYGVTVEEVFPYAGSPPSALEPGIMQLVSDTAARHFGVIPVIPELSTGATDGSFTRSEGIPTYGVGAVAEDPAGTRIHGKDERIAITSFNLALDYWYDLTRSVATLD
ncbi:M20/M25/M40 family metallo-hydrolase [Alteraurantiacibacter buctensis]|uniref:M20/M25/M40 family metallo-hydrolase n=1 Tax=Alteraurantiacibacter buctensis TaxID=1503981 RepID=A0A844YVZ4_9SPHN|nr:M20/M25/M40 family metallo-hydrolase [Alteraurantiacibacter buctensis]